MLSDEAKAKLKALSADERKELLGALNDESPDSGEKKSDPDIVETIQKHEARFEAIEKKVFGTAGTEKKKPPKSSFLNDAIDAVFGLGK